MAARFSATRRVARYSTVITQYPWLFIHIPKTGGTAIRTALGMGSVTQHVPARMMREKYPETSSKYSFAFIRNPWDRLVSYIHSTNETEWQQPNRFEQVVLTPQVDFIMDDAGRPMVDFIGRFENLADDFNTLCGNLGIATPPLPHLNQSKHQDYRAYYDGDDAAKQYVLAHYAEDIERFGYSL